MNGQLVLDLISGALTTAAWVCLPLLAGGFLIGTLVSLAQIVTSIQDPAVAAVPRLAGFLLVFLVSAGWMTTRLTEYAAWIFASLPQFAR
jgi:flagellar biosynthetic protein FliQ